MNRKEFCQLIRESIEEYKNQNSDPELNSLKNIETWARNANRNLFHNPKIVPPLLDSIEKESRKLSLLHQKNIHEVEFEYDEKEEIEKIKSIVKLSELAWKETDINKIKNHLLTIHNIADNLVDMHAMPHVHEEGVGWGDPNKEGPKRGLRGKARWEIDWRSEDDIKKHGKDPVFSKKSL